mgnify:CR=1 FL=1
MLEAISLTIHSNAQKQIGLLSQKINTTGK